MDKTTTGGIVMESKLGLTDAELVLEGARETRFVINDDGTLDTPESTYDMSAINAYIVKVQEDARRSNELIYKQALERGKSEGYHEARRRERSNEGQFYFTGENNLTVRVYAGQIDVMQYDLNGNQVVLEQVPQGDMMRILELKK